MTFFITNADRFAEPVVDRYPDRQIKRSRTDHHRERIAAEQNRSIIEAAAAKRARKNARHAAQR